MPVVDSTLSLPARLVAGTEAPSCVIFLGMLVSALVLSALRAYMVTSSLSNAHEMRPSHAEHSRSDAFPCVQT